MVVSQGFLPLPLEALAQQIGASKALIYKYFPTQQALANALVREHLPPLLNRELAEFAADGELIEIAERCATAYFDQVADHGPLLHILMSDLFAVGCIDKDLLDRQARVFGRLARRLRADLGFRARESLGAVRLLTALVEEAGTQAYRRPALRATCLDAALRAVEGGLAGLRELGAAPCEARAL